MRLGNNRLKNKLSEWKASGSGLGLCQVMGFTLEGVETLGSITTLLFG
jgi:hypothetical protein